MPLTHAFWSVSARAGSASTTRGRHCVRIIGLIVDFLLPPLRDLADWIGENTELAVFFAGAEDFLAGDPELFLAALVLRAPDEAALVFRR